MKVTCDYDENADVLYLTFDDAEPAICYDRDIPVLVRYNSGTDRVSGMTILNLKNLLSYGTHEKDISDRRSGNKDSVD